jgi:hypothetical protein
MRALVAARLKPTFEQAAAARRTMARGKQVIKMIT